MAIITLLTDSGESDHYVAAIKAKILSINPGVKIVDISHKISPCNIAHAAFVLKSVFREFPKGTVHLVGVDATGNRGDSYIALKVEDHFFVGVDNGLFGLITTSQQQNLVELNTINSITTTFPENMDAYLLCELDGNDEEVLMRDAERVMNVVEKFQIGEVLFAESASQKEELWKIRKNISPAVNWFTLTKSDDVVVPRANLPKLIRGIKEIGKRYHFNTVCFGHLGDGNLHVNILKEDISDNDWKSIIPEGISEIFKLTVSLGGTLSGEHGIGFSKRPYMPIAMSEVNLNLMRGIKKVFDPNGILNPEKIF